MSEIYLLIEGQQQGPYTEEQVRQSLADGSIPSDLPAWHEGLDDWVQVESLVNKDARLPQTSMETESDPSLTVPAQIPDVPVDANTVESVDADRETPAGRRKSRHLFYVAISVCAVAVIVGITVFVRVKAPHPAEPDSSTEVTSDQAATATQSSADVTINSTSANSDNVTEQPSRAKGSRNGDLVTFTTLDGKTYKEVHVNLIKTTDTGLEIPTTDGTQEVDYGQLPDDLSFFSETIRSNIKSNVDQSLLILDTLLEQMTRGGTNYPTAIHFSTDGAKLVTINYNKATNHSRSQGLMFDNAVVDRDNVDLVIEVINAKSDDGTTTQLFGMISLKGRTPDAVQLQTVGNEPHSVPTALLLVFPVRFPLENTTHTTALLISGLSTVFAFDAKKQLSSMSEKIEASSNKQGR